MTTLPPRPEEEAARLRKAAKLIAALYVHGLGPSAVAVMTAGQWAQLARCVGVRRPSPTTVALICDMVRSVEGYEFRVAQEKRGRLPRATRQPKKRKAAST